MGPDVQVLDSADKVGAVSVKVEGRSAGFNRFSPVFSEQYLYENTIIPEPSEKQAQVPLSNEFFIRMLDVVGSAFLFLLISPIIVFVAVLVKITSKGPVLYRQRRVGKSGKVFTLYKFRTMVEDAEKKTGPVWASKNDCRVTPLGKVLRCIRVDELPQLFNVFRGDMSLVGPRPERPYFVSRHMALQGVRLSVKPGLTGLAQVRAFYDLKPEHKLKYDMLYINRRSLLLNLYILFQTIPVIFFKRGW